MAVASITLGITACTTNKDNDNNSVSPAPGISLGTRALEMVKSQNNFAWRMMGEVNNNANGKNTICSPLSMVYCLGMVNTGAVGDTSDEITSVLGFSSGVADINQYCNKLLTELPKQDKTTKINIANCVEVNKPYTLLDAYKKEVETSYNALVENCDFSDSGFKDYINNWVSKQTEKMIPKLIDNVNQDAVAYIINALYFKGVWANKFDKANTQKAMFNKDDGSTTEIDMMYQTDYFKYAATADFQALNMDYGNGAYSMQILLPTEGKHVSDVIAAMQKQNWQDFLSTMSIYQVAVSIPRFSIEYGSEMNSLLINLGISKLFSSLEADLSNFSDMQTYISKIVQKAKIEVDEEGTKAAAATYAELECSSVGYENTITFTADKPFVFVITEHSTNTICFMGVYNGAK